MPDCIFCKIVAKELPSYPLWENERFFAFMDINPVRPGHMLVIPKQHIDSVFDIPEPLYAELFAIVKKLSEPLRQAMGSIRTGLVVEGFGVAHAHVNMLPIDKPAQMSTDHAQRAESSELTANAEKIRQAIQKTEAEK